MAKKIQIGFIGGGMIANAHMKNFHADRRTEIRAFGRREYAGVTGDGQRIRYPPSDNGLQGHTQGPRA